MASVNNTNNGTQGPVFLYLYSKQCKYCQIFYKDHWKKLKKSLKEVRSDIEIIRVNYKTMKEDSYDQDKYPKGLEFWGKFFPSFILVPRNLWDRAIHDSEVTMTIEDGALGMNMAVRYDGMLVPVRGYKYDDKGVCAWASTVLA